MANLTEFVEKLRSNIDEAVGDWTDGPLFMAEFYRAATKTLLALVDGNSAPEAKPKRVYKPRKAKPDTGTPKTE